MLVERAFGQAASVRSRSVSFASPCSAISFPTLNCPRRAQGSQTIESVAERTSAKVSEPSRGTFTPPRRF
jgi:hypothetical protein